MDATDTLSNTNRVSEPMTALDRAAVSRALQRFTTPACVSEMLQAHVPELARGTANITECAVVDSRFKTFLNPHSLVRSTVSACYDVRFDDAVTGVSSRKLLYVKAFLGGRSHEEYERLSKEDATLSECDRGGMHIPELDMILWRFPHDPGLRHLADLMDTEVVRHHLHETSLSRIMGSTLSHVLGIEIVNYRPEIRCTNKYHVWSRHRDRPVTVFGKTYRTGEGRALAERMEYLWDRSLRDPNSLSVAQPLGYTPAVGTVWQLGVDGAPLIEVLNASNAAWYVAACARGLASLHKSSVAGLTSYSVADHLGEVRKKILKLADGVPHLAEAFLALGDRLQATAPRPSEVPVRPIHWDFHICQLLALRDKVVFLDLDELVLGDPIQDLANFMVDLRFRLLDRPFVRAIGAHLSRAYQREADWEVSPDRLAWHAGIQFINKAYRAYIQHRPGFEAAVEDIVRLAGEGVAAHDEADVMAPPKVS